VFLLNHKWACVCYCNEKVIKTRGIQDLYLNASLKNQNQWCVFVCMHVHVCVCVYKGPLGVGSLGGRCGRACCSAMFSVHQGCQLWDESADLVFRKK
jgi:hypothetical protein